jgi:hypothetical protein
VAGDIKVGRVVIVVAPISPPVTIDDASQKILLAARIA